MNTFAKLRKDWSEAKPQRKVLFCFTTLGELMSGGLGIYCAIIFAISVTKTTDYSLLIPIPLCVIAMWVFPLIFRKLNQD